MSSGGNGPVRIALVHDWLTGMRGGERVLEVLCSLFPHAELFTLVHVPGSVSPIIERCRLHTSVIQHLPWSHRLYRHYLPLFPIAIEQFDLDPFDLVVSTSHCAAKAVVTTGRARHLCYCHTPMRYAWDQYDAYFGPARIGRLRSRLIRPVMRALARWDADTAQRVDRFVANSGHVAGRIRRYYNRRAAIVPPPVDVAFFSPDDTAPGRHFLVVSALVPYKRIEVAIEACRSVGARLKILGQGPELERLRRVGAGDVDFLGTCSDEGLRQHYREAAAVLLPGEEDFGIAPVEAQACGRPVVALARGGALETVVDGVTGILVADPSVTGFAEGLARVQQTAFDAARLHEHALAFSRDQFAARMQAQVDDTLAAPAGQLRW